MISFESVSALAPSPVRPDLPAQKPAGSAAAASGCSSCGANTCSGCGDKAVNKTADAFELSEEDKRAVSELRARDREVRAHERAHQAAGGQYAGAASYTFQQGPDGRAYAIGGEVPIDASPVQGDPQATIDKMQQVKRAALAPAKPSAQDRKVAALADAEINKARAELNAGKTGEDEFSSQSTIESSLNQHLGEAARNTGPSEAGSSASTATDLTAYAANAYRHQASPFQR